jgi:hypothetical protein
VTKAIAIAMALSSIGWKYGFNLFHLCFPHAQYDESSRGIRLHLPVQFINGADAGAAIMGNLVLGE